MVILLNGSPRKKGATAGILQYISEQLEKQGIKTYLIHASDLNLQYCTGCSRCFETGTCVYKDDMEDLSSKIEKADGLILGTPTYASNLSGQLKTMIDRGHFVMEQLLHNKYALGVVTYENYGGRDASKILNKLFLYSGAAGSRSLQIKTASSKNPLADHRNRRRIEKGIRHFQKDLTGQRKPKLQALKHFVIFQLGILPFVKRKGRKYAGVVEKWKKNGIQPDMLASTQAPKK